MTSINFESKLIYFKSQVYSYLNQKSPVSFLKKKLANIPIDEKDIFDFIIDIYAS